VRLAEVDRFGLQVELKAERKKGKRSSNICAAQEQQTAADD
jgi:hypothetical protein